MHHRDAEEQGDHDDLHHRHRAHRCEDVAGEHVDNLVHHRQLRCVNDLRRCIKVYVDKRKDAFQKGAQRHCKEGGRHEVEEGAEPQFAHL